MKSERGITLIKLLIIAIIIIAVIIFIVANSQGKSMVNIEWGYMPSSEYYELRLAATTSETLGSGTGTLPLESFNTLGKDVKDSNGKWFKNSDVNFKTLILDDASGEGVTLTDGEHVAIFLFVDGNDYVFYMFLDKEEVKNSTVLDENLKEKNLLGGYKITIE